MVTERTSWGGHTMALTLLVSVFFASIGAITTLLASGSWGLATLAYVGFGMVALLSVSLLRSEDPDDVGQMSAPAH